MLDVIFIMGVMVSTAGLLSAPCLRRRRPCREDDTDASSRAGLLQQKDTLYTAIRELEFDFQTGKVDQQEYTELRQQLEWEVVYVLHLLDACEPCTALEVAREQHIAPLRQRPTGVSPILPASACLSCGAGLQSNEPCCPSCAQEHREREEKSAIRPPT
jgi:hypothetical protein